MYGRNKDIFQCMYEGSKEYGFLYYIFKQGKKCIQNFWRIFVYRKPKVEQKPKICEQWKEKWLQEESDDGKEKKDLFYLLCMYDYQYSCEKVKLNKKKNFRVKFWCILPFILITILFFGGIIAYNIKVYIDAGNFKNFLDNNNWNFSIFGTVFYSGALILTYGVSKWLDVKQYQETWSRHAEHKYAVEIEMFKYISYIDEYYFPDRREKFIENIMKTWDKNQQKFVDNMKNEKCMKPEELISNMKE